MNARRGARVLVGLVLTLALLVGWGTASGGSRTTIPAPAEVETTPTQVSGLTGVTAIAAGRFHSLALKSDGTVWAWGNNQWGELGDGTTTQRDTPVQVLGLHNVHAIAAGGYFSMALYDDGTSVDPYKIYAWGRNDNGQLGIDNDTIQMLTTPEQAELPNVQQVSGGADHTVALRSTTQEVFTWGNNDYGQLGNPFLPWGGVAYSFQHVLNPEGAPFGGVDAITAGHDHSLALRSGAVWAWGYNYYGQLGDGTNANRNSPVQVQGLNGAGFLTGVTAIAGGEDHSLALTSDGTVWAWGYNREGELGDGAMYFSRNIPAQVVGLSNVQAIAGGMLHSLALKADGTAWAWGSNDFGQLGDGTLTNRATPVQVVGLSGVTALAGGRMHSLALKNDGTVWSWGDNTYGQLGGVRAVPPGATYPICHKPGTPAEKTLYLPKSAFTDHLGHGDELGACSHRR